jgi:hypothetical protein
LSRSGSAFPKPYLIAADKGLPTLGSLTNAISKVLGSGQVQMCTKPQVTQTEEGGKGRNTGREGRGKEIEGRKGGVKL